MMVENELRISKGYVGWLGARELKISLWTPTHPGTNSDAYSVILERSGIAKMKGEGFD